MVDVINPSITAGIGGQSDPLGMFAKFAYTQNVLMQGQLYKAKQAAGQLYTQSLGPDGQPDLAKYGAMLASHPETSMYAAEAMNEAINTRRLNADLLQTQLQNKGVQMQRTAGIYKAISEDPDVNNMGDVVKKGYASDLSGLGIPYSELLPHLSDTSPGKPASLNGDQFRQFYAIHSKALLYGADATHMLTQQYDPHGGGQTADGSWVGAYRTPMGRTTIPSSGQVYDPSQGGAPSAVPQTAGAAGAVSAGPTAGAAALTPGATFSEVSPVRAKRLADVGTYGEGVDSRAGAARGLVFQMSQVQDLLKHFDPNRAASIRTELGSIAHAAGASKDLQDQLAGGDLSDAVAAKKLFFGIGGGIAAKILHDANARGSQLLISRSLSEASPNIDMPAGGVAKVMAAMRETANIARWEQTHLYARYGQPGYDIANVQKDWGDTLDDYTRKRGELP